MASLFDMALTALTLDARERGTEQYSTGKDGNSIIGSELTRLRRRSGQRTRTSIGYSTLVGILHDPSVGLLSHTRNFAGWLRDQRTQSTLTMCVHDYEWIPVEITIRTEGATDYLGGLYDA